MAKRTAERTEAAAELGQSAVIAEVAALPQPDGTPPAEQLGTCPHCSTDAAPVDLVRAGLKPSWVQCPRGCGFRFQNHAPMIAALRRQRGTAERVAAQDRSAR